MRKYLVGLRKGLFIAIFCVSTFNVVYAQKVVNIYVSEDKGNDRFKGSIDSPYASIERAKETIKILKDNAGVELLKVVIRGGVYYLKEPLRFSNKDGGDKKLHVEYTAYKNETVVISGGRKIKGAWIRSQRNPRIWQISLPWIKGSKNPFRQLWVNGRRLQRASSDIYFTSGSLPNFKDQLGGSPTYSSVTNLKKYNMEALCGFSFEGDFLKGLTELDNAEVLMYHSWEASWHKIHKIDDLKKIVLLKNPLRYPVGYFGPRVRFRVENAMVYLDKPGEWYLNSSRGILEYFSEADENPNEMHFASPVLERLVEVSGVDYNHPVKNLTFSRIKFRNSSFTWGIHGIEYEFRRNFKDHLWIDFKEGFSSAQGALDCGSAIILEYTENCKILQCEFSQLGNYAITIGKYSSKNIVKDSKIFDTGGGGIILGFNKDPIKERFPYEMSPSFNSLINNSISNGGVVHPSSIGIIVMQSHHNIITNNEIYNMPYSGISLGWSFGFKDNFTSNNFVGFNNIWDVMQQLADGGGIYTLGPQKGTEIKGNYIHNVYRNKQALGSQANGIFFDEGSSEFRIDSNVIESVGEQDIRFNRTDSSKISWGKNSFEKTSKNLSLNLKIKSKVGPKS